MTDWIVRPERPPGSLPAAAGTPRAQRPRLATWQWVSLAIAFVLSAISTSILSDGYLTNFIKIAKCPATPPHPNLTLVRCEGVGTLFYYSGALYLNINKELVQSLRAADVVIIGNSRT